MTGGVDGLQGFLAEFAAVDADLLAKKPANFTRREAATLWRDSNRLPLHVGGRIRCRTYGWSGVRYRYDTVGGATLDASFNMVRHYRGHSRWAKRSSHEPGRSEGSKTKVSAKTVSNIFDRIQNS
jgi:NADPH:quinone reductase-like Zn-dependent oxidoreductase